MSGQTFKKGFNFIRKRILIIAAALLLAAGGMYLFVAHHYKGYFLPGTSINGTDVSTMSLPEFEEILKAEVAERTLRVTFPEGESHLITADEIDLRYLEDDKLAHFVERQNYLGWVAGFFGWDRTYTYEPSVSYDYGKLVAAALSWPELDPEQVTAPADAYLRFNDDNLLEIVPEEEGNTVDEEVLKGLLKQAVDAAQSELDLTGAEGLYLTPSVRKDDEALIGCLDEVNPFLKTKVTYQLSDGSEEVLDAALTKKWLYPDSEGLYRIDRAGIGNKAGAYIATLAEKDDNYGRYRAFFSTNFGLVKMPSEELHGHRLNQKAMAEELTEDLLSGRSASHSMQYSVFQDENDMRLGGSYIEIDIDSQHVYHYRDGNLVYDAPCVTGLNNATPIGIFAVERRWHDTVLEGPPKEDGTPSYLAHVDYFVQFYPTYGLHDASWRASWEFGGDTYLYDGSHGCVNLPYEAAEYFYYEAEDGTPVIVFSNQRLPVIEDENLPLPDEGVLVAPAAEEAAEVEEGIEASAEEQQNTAGDEEASEPSYTDEGGEEEPASYEEESREAEEVYEEDDAGTDDGDAYEEAYEEPDDEDY